jgi:hypothetical protein
MLRHGLPQDMYGLHLSGLGVTVVMSKAKVIGRTSVVDTVTMKDIGAGTEERGVIFGFLAAGLNTNNLYLMRAGCFLSSFFYV